MAAIKFGVLELTRNHGFPATRAYNTPAIITGVMGDGTVVQEIVGTLGAISLTWPAECPIPLEEYVDLRQFYLDVDGPGQAWVYTDEHGATWDVRFAKGPQLSSFTTQAHGYAGTIELVVLGP